MADETVSPEEEVVATPGEPVTVPVEGGDPEVAVPVEAPVDEPGKPDTVE